MTTVSNALKENKRKINIFRITFVSVMLVLIVIFTFLDEQASKALYGYDNIFGKIFSYTFFVLGYVPAIFVDSVLFACAFCKAKKKPLKVLFAVLVYSTLFGAVYTVFEALPEVSSGIKYGIIGTVAIIGAFFMLWGFKKFSPETIEKLFYIFLIGAIMASLAFGSVALIQYTWGRDRFFAILNGVEGAKYTPWYLPQGASSIVDFRSFPSMHSSSSASLVMLIFIVWRFEIKGKKRIALISTAILIIVCVPLSRIVMGWHYFTDVLFALLISYGALELAILIGDKVYGNKKAGMLKNEQSL